MGFTSFLLKPRTKKSTGPARTLSTQPAPTIQVGDHATEPTADRNMLHYAAVGRTKPLSFQEAYEDLIVLRQRQDCRIVQGVDVTNKSAIADIKRVDGALIGYKAIQNLPEALRKSIFVRSRLRKAYRAAKAIERHPYRAAGPKHQVSISAYNAVLQVQDNAYAYMITPGQVADPDGALLKDTVKLQPRNDLLKALIALEKTVASLDKSLKAFNDKKKMKAIEEVHNA